MYTYKPLLSPKEFRLLELLPGSVNDEIQCILNHESLVQHQPYSAASFTWGDPTLIGAAKLDGADVPVRDNLYQLLRHLRQPHSSLILWIDALCINQENIPEKNIQVPLMGQIYSSANSVFVWLGLHADGSEQYFRSLSSRSKPRLDSEAQRDTPSGDDSRLNEQATHLYSRPYWSRTWIVQEIVLASDLTIFCGNRSCHWSTFVSGPSGYQERNPNDPLAPDHAFVNTVALRQAGTATKLRRLLFRFRMTYCFDPRDRVYSLLNFAEDTRDKDHGIIADYSSTIEALFVQTLAFCSGHGCRALISGQTAVECLRFCDALATRLGAGLEPSLDCAKDALRSRSNPVLSARLACKTYYVSLNRFARIAPNAASDVASDFLGASIPLLGESHTPPRPLLRHHVRSIPAKETFVLCTLDTGIKLSNIVFTVDFDSPNEAKYQICYVCTHNTDEDDESYDHYTIAGLGLISSRSGTVYDNTQFKDIHDICTFLDSHLQSLKGREVSDSVSAYIMEITLQELVAICQLARTTGAYLPWTLSKASTVDHWQEPRDAYSIWKKHIIQYSSGKSHTISLKYLGSSLGW